MNDYININDIIKNYDEKNNDYNYSDSELFYNDFISNYEEV